jgi:nucleotide-binding universal stress UspA family protein
MTFKDILLHLDTYPDPAATETVDEAVALCAQLGRAVTALGVHVEIPLKRNRLADLMIKLSDMAKDEEQRSLRNAEAVLARVQQQAEARGLPATSVILRALLYEEQDRVAEIARTHDLCVTPYGLAGGPQAALAETVAFGSGRPVVIFKPSPGRQVGPLERIVIAWDGGRAAARAVADAMPLLIAAKEVRILVVVNEKASVARGLAGRLRRHLAAHGVTPALDEIDAGAAPIGTVIAEHVALHRADLLVMGAFGHSRVREFVLGGATQSIISDPPIPVLMSH